MPVNHEFAAQNERKSDEQCTPDEVISEKRIQTINLGKVFNGSAIPCHSEALNLLSSNDFIKCKDEAFCYKFLKLDESAAIGHWEGSQFSVPYESLSICHLYDSAGSQPQTVAYSTALKALKRNKTDEIVAKQISQVLSDNSQDSSSCIQNCVDSLKICYSRLHYYTSQRISNRFKQPGKYLLKCKSKEIREFLEKLNKSLERWGDAKLKELHNPAFHQYISDLAYIIRLVQYDSNLRQMDSNVLEALQHLYQNLSRLIPDYESIQLSLFDSSDTFHEEIKENKFIHKVMIDFEWVPVLAFVGRFLRRFSKKVVSFPASLVCPKSSWRSVFNGRQLSFADIRL
jgi:hypothetical protein